MASVASPSWKEQLTGRIPEALEREIEVFETQIQLRKQGKLDEKVFAETRLRRGAYGQRYDNGQRHDGLASRELAFPSGTVTKGPMTMWDAPGMLRIKIPFGGLSAEQMQVLADLAEEYSDGILHITTRQDFQLHFVHIEDTPIVMRRLGAVGITTREACGNSVRNVTACPYSGVCHTEAFDVTPYAEATARFLLGHPDTQDFGRKFKIAFSGCREEACALVAIHDLGCIAERRVAKDGSEERGFALYVGGGLGSVPHQAQLFDAFCPEEELFPLAQALCRVFARLGEKKNRQKARLKFLVQKLGLEELRRLVVEERSKLAVDPRWTEHLPGIRERRLDGPLTEARPEAAAPEPAGLAAWRATNLRPQSQPGYVVAHVRVPLGDLSSRQLRVLADLARRFTGDTVRLTVDQNLVFRWVREADLPALYQGLEAIGVAGAGAGTLSDITACPGTDTCKLGISSSRGLAAELSERLDGAALDPAVRALHIKASGCFNACGQHHVADLGFLGVSRNVRGRRVPHFQLVLGGQWSQNGGAYGLAIGAMPSKRIPEVISRMTDRFVKERQGEESFQAFVKRIGKAQVKEMLKDLTEVPLYEEDPSFYSDWGDPREYTIGDMGVGECAGEVVSLTEFGIADAEREAFEAQLLLDQGEARGAAERAYQAMIRAARALVLLEQADVPEDPAQVVTLFRVRLHDTQLFHDPFAGDKFAQYLFGVHGEPFEGLSEQQAHQRIEEANLFIEASHACYARMSQTGAASR